MQARLVAFLAVFIFLFAGLNAVQVGFWDSGMEGGMSEQTTDTVTALEGETVTLTKSASNIDGLVYSHQREVTVEQSNDPFIAQGNWTWNRHNGTITFQEGMSLANDTNTDVTYGFAVPTDEQELVKTLSLTHSPWTDAWQTIAAVGLVIAALAVATRAGR